MILEYAKYQWYWNARTQWLAEHSDERNLDRYRTNWEKRQAMTTRFNELRELVLEHGRAVQACAMALGTETALTLKDDWRYRLDFTQTGDTLSVVLHQWRDHLAYNPEQPPF